MLYEIPCYAALLMGLIEGLTEFLPISSTGHLIIAGDLLGLDSEKAKTFEIFIQLGAILAVCWHYRGKISQVTVDLVRAKEARSFVFNLILAFIPAACLGVLFHEAIKTYLFHPVKVAIALVVGGLLILFIERRERRPKISTVDDLRWTDALKIGCIQALALIPGTSRSGATIIGGLLFGLSRQVATEFSFFLAIPTMLAATLYALAKGWQTLGSQDIAIFAFGFLASFISALLAVKGLLHFVANHSFRVFGYYRIAFGLLTLLYFSR
ncbi:MAG: undecaprenyl-diphosphate phosphatase [Gammaproteobacteria bacterium]